MIVKSAELETVCGITSKLPDNELPEIAFAGKSNVGKSSLINGLLNRKSLARTSAQPGKPQTICKGVCGDQSEVGKDDRELFAYISPAQKGIFADRYKACSV